MKTARGRGNVVENIRASNIVMHNVGTGISLDMFYGDPNEDPVPVTEETPHFRLIHYSHITGSNLKIAGEIWGLPEAPMQGVHLSDVYLEAETGLQVKFTKDIALRDVEVNVKRGAAFHFFESQFVELEDVVSRTPVAATPVILLENVSDGVVRDCSAVPDTEIFLQIKGSASNAIEVFDNRLDYARQAVVLSDSVADEAVRFEPR
jgi:hypothetical protein